MPIRRDPVDVLAFPFRTGEALAVVSFGAALVFLISLVPWFVKPFVVALALYPSAYLLDVTKRAMTGRRDPPGWPDFNPSELFDTAWKLAAVGVACFLPACLLAIPVASATWGSLTGPDPGILTIGEYAHQAAGMGMHVPKGTSASGAVFFTLEGTPVTLRPGRYTILGLLGRDDADDTGMSAELQDMPVSVAGFTMFPGHQAYDLDRVGRALGDDVDVLAAYADPTGRLMTRRWDFLKAPKPAGAGGGDVDVDEDYGSDDSGGYDDEGGGRVEPPLPTAAARPASPFRALRFVRTEGHAFPKPFDALDRVPAVYVIDPDGKVVREYEMGVYDEKLYADMQDLRWGGDGEASPTRLPASAYGVDRSLVLVALGWAAVVLLYGLGLLYYPMALVMVAVFESASVPFSYPMGLRAIRACAKDYLVVAALSLGVQVGAVTVMLPLGVLLRVLLPWWLEWLFVDYATQWLAFAGALVGAYGIGRLYHANAEAIGWFTRRPSTSIYARSGPEPAPFGAPPAARGQASPPPPPPPASEPLPRAGRRAEIKSVRMSDDRNR